MPELKPSEENADSQVDTEANPPRGHWPILTGLFWGGLIILIIELIWTFATGLVENVHLAPPFYLSAVVGITIGAWLLHAIPLWGLYELGRYFKIDRQRLLVGAAAVFGVFIQYPLVLGDGIGAHPYFPLIRIAFLVGFPVAFASFTWLLVTPRIPGWIRAIIGTAAFFAGVAFNLFVLREYQPFHGLLVAYNGALFVGLLAPLWRRRWMQRATMVLVVAVAVTTATIIPDHERGRTHVQRFSHLPASMMAGLPGGSLLQVEPEDLLGAGDATAEELLEYYSEHFGDPDAVQQPTKRGDNVLFVVLESVRADYWDDPELAPEFHRWKKRGLYFPRAVAQYPATPLAYGALFTAQPPSVIAQTPYWGEQRLFDDVKEQVDHVFLTQPDNEWFEHTAISDFFVRRAHTVNTHEKGPQGLQWLKTNMSLLNEDETFFSWVHLYEPHSPYEAREPWADDDADRKTRYRSEVSYTDKHLGAFMDWFFEQPYADDTLVIVVGDHGQAMGEEIMGESFWGHHVHVHNLVSDVPMFIAGPDLPQQARDEELGVMQLDVMPTIYDFSGLAFPQGFMAQGSSLYELLEDRRERPLVTEAFSIRGGPFFDFVATAQQGGDPRALRRRFREISTDGQRYSPKVGLQQGDYKIVYDRLLQKSWLYNIAEDPQESRDISEEQPEKAQLMVKRLQNWHQLQDEIVQSLDRSLK